MRIPLPRTLLPVLFAGGLLLGGLLIFCGTARAEDGEGPKDDPRAKLKAQAEKILRLMRENEAALLEASTLGGAAPKGPVVPIPDPPPSPQGSPQGSPPEGSPPSGGTPPPEGGTPPNGGNQGARGEEIRKRLEELIKGQQKSAGRIPDELAELVRMVPKGQGSGSGSGEPQPGEGEGGEMTPEARDAKRRKDLQEQQERDHQKGGQDPQGAEKHEPNDGRGRPPSDPNLTPQNPSDPNTKPWQASLPPELRTSEAGGGLNKLPGRLGQIIDDYLRNMHRQTTPGGTGR